MSENVRDYVIAAAKLYGMVPVNKVVEIYNTQNEDQITNKDLRRIVRKYQPYDCFAFIGKHGELEPPTRSLRATRAQF